MSEAIIQALRRKYMENIGNPAAQLIGGGVRGYLGLDQPEYADQLGREAYANAQALSNAPGIGAPAGAFKAMAAAPLMVKALRKPRNMIVWHGAKDPTWIDRGEAFNPNMTANMPSKYLWTSPNQDTAKTYAGISEMQLEKAASGLGSAPPSTAGIRQMELEGSAKVLKVNDVKKTSKELGIEWGGENPLEMFLDAAKAKGYDAVQMKMDGGNIAVLNPSVVRYGPNMDAQIKALRKKNQD